MGKLEKVLLRILEGKYDSNITFEDIRLLLLRLAFVERIRGSHHSFRKEGIGEKPNLQRDGSKAKAYQVKQIRKILLKYGLGGKLDGEI